MKYLLVFISLFPSLILAQTPSNSTGSPKNGRIENAYKIPRKGINYIYFSKLSYYIFRNSYVNSNVYKTVLDTYVDLNKIRPNQKYVLMECSNKKGGKMTFHHTHQNGLSVDFMTPLLKNNHSKFYKGLGFFRYLLNFDSIGHKNKNVEIDFNTTAEHIYYLEKNARKNGLKISKVIFKICFKEKLFNTEYGKKLKKMNIYFAQVLTNKVDKAHDDHYHIDFEEIK